MFWVNVRFGALGVLAAHRFIPESTDPAATRRVDMVGLILATGAPFSLTYTLIKANDYGWTSPVIDALFAAAVIAGTGFVLVERHVGEPLVDLTLFRSRVFTGANVVALIVNLAAFGASCSPACSCRTCSASHQFVPGRRCCRGSRCY